MCPPMSDLFVVLLPGGVELRGAVLADPLVAVVVVPHALHLRRAVLADPVALRKVTIRIHIHKVRRKGRPQAARALLGMPGRQEHAASSGRL